jgi:hypothetical protein
MPARLMLALCRKITISRASQRSILKNLDVGRTLPRTPAIYLAFQRMFLHSFCQSGSVTHILFRPTPGFNGSRNSTDGQKSYKIDHIFDFEP